MFITQSAEALDANRPICELRHLQCACFEVLIIARSALQLARTYACTFLSSSIRTGNVTGLNPDTRYLELAVEGSVTRGKLIAMHSHR